MSLRFHEIAESNHRILNPFMEEQMRLLGEICRLQPDRKLLDLACGKGEMLCRWAHQFGIQGTGVDISTVFLEAAEKRALELDVGDNLNFVQEDAGKYPQADHSFDIVSCLGATWIGDGLLGTLDLMKPAVKQDGLLLVGEPFWIEPPPEDAFQIMNIGEDDYTSLAGTLERFHASGLQLVEMVLANLDGWDRYEAQQWMAVDDFLRAHPADPEASALKQWIDQNQRAYLQYGRQYLGWGVFVLRFL